MFEELGDEQTLPLKTLGETWLLWGLDERTNIKLISQSRYQVTAEDPLALPMAKWHQQDYYPQIKDEDMH
ncbi:hypothetical protein STEG23_029549 [Scotinomys teguina]